MWTNFLPGLDVLAGVGAGSAPHQSRVISNSDAHDDDDDVDRVC